NSPTICSSSFRPCRSPGRSSAACPCAFTSARKESMRRSAARRIRANSSSSILPVAAFVAMSYLTHICLNRKPGERAGCGPEESRPVDERPGTLRVNPWGVLLCCPDCASQARCCSTTLPLHPIPLAGRCLTRPCSPIQACAHLHPFKHQPAVLHVKLDGIAIEHAAVQQSAGNAVL